MSCLFSMARVDKLLSNQVTSSKADAFSVYFGPSSSLCLVRLDVSLLGAQTAAACVSEALAYLYMYVELYKVSDLRQSLCIFFFLSRSAVSLCCLLFPVNSTTGNRLLLNSVLDF